MATVPTNQGFFVNSVLDSSQNSPAIAMNSEGDFAIAWNSFHRDGTTLDVYAKRFDVNGTAVGSDFLVNETVDGYQYAPDIAIDDDKTVQVVWQGIDSGGLTDIYARTFSLGVPIGRETLINDDTEFNQTNPAISRNDDDFVMVWDSSSQGFNIVAHSSKFESGEQPIVNTDVKTSKFNPDVAMNSDGEFVAVWASNNQDNPGDSRLGIYAQIYNSEGQPQGEERLVNQTVEGSQQAPAVAIDKNGGFVAAWKGPDDDGLGVFARRFDSLGNPLTDEFLVHTSPVGYQDDPDVAMNDDGTFVVTWTNTPNDDSDSKIYARLFDTSGIAQSDEYLVSEETQENSSPVVAMNDNGDFVVAWQGVDPQQDTLDIFARRYERASVVEFSRPTYTISENGVPTGVSLSLNRLDETDLTAQVSLRVAGGNASAGADYRFNSPQTITFTPGETSKTINIPILQDQLVEGNETILFRINALNDATVGTNETARLTILDDDNPVGGGNPGGGNPGGGNSGGGNPGGGNNTQFIRGTNRKDRLTGTNASETLIGMGSNDRIRARGGDDVLIGVNPNSRRPGKRERDKLIGNGGDDLFVLGDERKVFYDDGRRKSSGLKDYALIKGFNKRQDTLQLHGKARDYVLGSSPKGKGLGLFLEGKEDELIAVIRGNTNNLRLNSNAFEFV